MRAPPSLTLPISTRRIAAPAGARTVDEVVTCPLRAAAVAVDTCVRCEHCAHVRLAAAGRSSIGCELPEALAPADEPAGLATIADVMSREVQCVRGGVTARELAALLDEGEVGGAPVVDAAGHVRGVVSKSDLVRCLREGHDLDATTVDDLMCPVPFVLPARASIERAAALMTVEHVHRVPVVAPDGAVVGIVSALDVVRAVARLAGPAA